MKGVTAAVIASQGRFRSKRVICSDAAICMARWTASGFRSTPDVSDLALDIP